MRYKLSKIISIGCILSLTLTFTACNKTPSKEEELSRVYKSVQASREEYMKRRVTLKDEHMNWNQGEDEGKGFTKEYVDKLLKYSSAKLQGTEDYDEEFKCDPYKVLTKEQALEDVEDLFKKLKLYYGSYGYFGGDGVFNKAKDAIEAEVENSKDIRVKDLSDIIFKNLQFIKDLHFAIGENSYTKSAYFYKCYYYSTDIYSKDEKGYYKKDGMSRDYIKSIDGDKNIELYMKESLTKDGSICYRMAILKETENQWSINKNVTYSKSGDKVETFNAQYSNYDPNSKTNYTKEDGIPILKMPSMLMDSPEFIRKCGEQMKEYPICIIDLRGNMGGYISGPYEWIKSYTGVEPENIGASCSAKSYIGSYLSQGANNSKSSMFKDIKQSVIKKKIPNKNKVFVLMDKFCGSAAEYFIEQLMTMENVYFIGSNTLGCMIAGNAMFHFLKNSKLQVELGLTHYQTSYSDDFEFTGFKPDLLCIDDSLEAVKKFIKNYNIK